LVVAGALGVGASPLALAFVACSSFEATPGGADGIGGELEAGPAEGAGETATEAAVDGNAVCGPMLGADFLKERWTLGGSAMFMGNFDVVLTDAVPSQRALAWHALDLGPMQSLHAIFTLTVTTTDVAPADGVTFFWSGDAPPLIGGDGNLLGFCGGVNGGAVALVSTVIVADSGVPRSKVVVKHNEPARCVDDGPGATTEALAAIGAGSVSATLEIVLDVPANSITVRRNGKIVIDHQRLGYDPNPIKAIGFTAATGNDYARHEIQDFNLTSCP
jgi:hypothetical protein